MAGPESGGARLRRAHFRAKRGERREHPPNTGHRDARCTRTASGGKVGSTESRPTRRFMGSRHDSRIAHRDHELQRERRAGVSPAQRRRRASAWPLRGQDRRDARPTLRFMGRAGVRAVQCLTHPIAFPPNIRPTSCRNFADCSRHTATMTMALGTGATAGGTPRLYIVVVSV
jgi:hypothetical protein